MAQGHSNTAIARGLTISEKAVVQHTSQIYDRLGLYAQDDDTHRRVCDPHVDRRPCWPRRAVTARAGSGEPPVAHRQPTARATRLRPDRGPWRRVFGCRRVDRGHWTGRVVPMVVWRE